MSKIIEELNNINVNYSKTIQIVSGGTNSTSNNSVGGLIFSQKRQIATIEFYSNSRYLNGQKDELGREKPFFNILNAICDVENAAKDLDTKDISITSDDPNHYMESFLLSKDIYVWMKVVNFAKTLNDMRDIHTRYGSLLVKKCIKTIDGKKVLVLEMPEWKNTMTDQVDIINGSIVETHWLNAKQLSDMTEWDEAAVKEVLQKFNQQSSITRVPVYEMRGWFPLSYYLEANGKKPVKGDDQKYTYQLYYIAGSPTDIKGVNFVDPLTVMYSENDTEQIYKYVARKPKAGRAFGVGVMEEGEEAQVWVNDTVLKQYRAMEYTTKVVMQSSSKKLKGRNLLTETDDGTILEHEDGKPITEVPLLPAGGLNQYGNLIQQWYGQLEKTTSAYAAQRGDAPPSGTPFRLQATVLNQSSSVFKTLQQEFGIFVTEIVEDWIMPYLATQLNKEHILAYNFSPEELKEIDKSFSTREANLKAAEFILSGKIVSQDQYDQWLQMADTFIKSTKAQRFIQIPKDYYKDLKAKVTVNITGEQRNKAATLESLNNILITGSKIGLPAGVLQQVMMKIIELSGAGISPINITAAIAEDAKQNQGKQGLINRVSQSMNYKDVPDDIKRQIEQEAGLQPSQAAAPVAAPAPLSLSAKA